MRRSRRQPKPHSLAQRILQAKLPADSTRFTAEELDAAGITNSLTSRSFAQLRREWPQAFTLVVVALEKARLLEQRDLQRNEAEASASDPSGITLMKASLTENPLEQAELRELAYREHQAWKQRLALQEEQEMETFLKSRPSVLKRKRDKSPRWISHWLWHEPMTIRDLTEATGKTRKSVQGVLTKLAAKGERSGDGANQPLVYPPEVCFHVMRHFLTVWSRDKKRRQDRVLRIIAETLQREHSAADRVFQELRPVVEELCATKDGALKFEQQHRAVVAKFTPKPPEHSEPGLLGLWGNLLGSPLKT